MSEENFTIIRPFGPSIAKLKLPNEIILELNKFVDGIISDKKKSVELDHGENLAGNVKQEFKVTPEILKSSGLLNFLANGVSKWIEVSEKKKIKNFNIISSWIVRQFQNEYNPVHLHDGHVSGVGYLKLPKNMISNKLIKNKKIKTNGTIDFINGQKNFLSKSIFNIVPKIRDLLIFPNYLMHTAYPFKSSGERRSFSFNLEIDNKIANVFSR